MKKIKLVILTTASFIITTILITYVFCAFIEGTMSISEMDSHLKGAMLIIISLIAAGLHVALLAHTIDNEKGLN